MGDDNTLNDREQFLLAYCVNYAKEFPTAGAPGHTLILLVAKLSNQIEALEKLQASTVEDK